MSIHYRAHSPLPPLLLLVLLLAPALLAPAAAWGASGSTPLVLSLQKALSLAEAHSPDIAASRSATEVARSDLHQVQSAYYPQLQTTAVVGPTEQAKTPIVRNGQIYDPSPPTSLDHLTGFGRLDFTLTQPLYTFGKLDNRKKAARLGVQASALDVARKKAQLALRVKKLYYALVLARGGVESAKEAEGFYADVRQRFKRLLALNSPNVTQSDLYRLEAFRADTLRSQAEAQKGVEVASYALKAMLGLPADQTIKPADASLALPHAQPPPLKTFVGDALAERPEIRQLTAAVKARRFLAEAAHSDLYPSFFAALVGSLAWAPNRDHFNNPYFTDEFNHAYVGAVAGLRWNFDFGIGRAKEEGAWATYHTLVHTLDYARRNIPIQVAQSYAEMIEAQKAAQAYRQATDASRKWVVTSMSDFDIGLGTALDMLDSIAKYGHNQGGYLEALYNYYQARAELHYAAGIATGAPEDTP